MAPKRSHLTYMLNPCPTPSNTRVQHHWERQNLQISKHTSFFAVICGNGGFLTIYFFEIGYRNGDSFQLSVGPWFESRWGQQVLLYNFSSFSFERVLKMVHKYSGNASGSFKVKAASNSKNLVMFTCGDT